MHFFRRGCYLAAAFELAGDFGDRFVGDLAGFADPAHSQKVDAEGVQAALVHEGAGHDAVVDEVAGEEPIVGMDVGFAGDLAEGVAASGGVEF